LPANEDLNIQPPFVISVLMSFVAFGVVTKLQLWRWLQTRRRNEALLALVVPHLFRFVGLSFLVPGVVSPELPRAIAVPAAYGDLGAAILALIATLALARRASWAIERWALRCSSRLRSCRRC
jgi:hypothetical protein